MLVTLKEILKIADEGRFALGAFNTPNLESIVAVLNAAEKRSEPVVLMHAQIHEKLIPLTVIGPVMVLLAKKSKVPVCVHLDHGEDLYYLKVALDIGFTSIMYDGSKLDFDENVKNTRRAVALASMTGASVEAEIGRVLRPETESGKGGYVDGMEDDADMYTDPVLAEKFCRGTGIDALACAFGSVHGFYAKEPNLDYARLDKIRSLISVPIVMHGGSGISAEDFEKAIGHGVRKINYYTYLARAGGEAVKARINGETPAMFHDIVAWATKGMEDNVAEAMEMFHPVPGRK